MKMYSFQLTFDWNLFLRVQLQYSSIGAHNGLAPAKCQAIVWTNGGQFTEAYMRNSASMSSGLYASANRIIIA